MANYNLVVAVWAPLDYINILFYLFGAYFFIVLVKGEDISLLWKVFLFGLSLPAWYITLTNQTVPSFNQPLCEAFNSPFLTEYKLIIEAAVILFIIGFSLFSFKKSSYQKRRQMIIVGVAMLLFFGVFSITEYISSQTGIYEINLYSLFVLPVFLGFIIYSIVNLEIFKLRSFVTQLTVYILLVMIGSQFFFLQSTTDKALTVVTFIMSLAFCYLLIKSVRREAQARKQVETLALELEKSNLSLEKANEKLKGLDKLKSEFLSLASHQLRTPLTAIKGYASMLFEGSFGKLDPKQEEGARRIYTSAQGLVNTVEDLLDISKIEQGGMKYEFMPTDLGQIVTDLYNEMKIPAESKNLEFTLELPKDQRFMVNADPVKIKQVLLNLTDNSIKYTKEGFVKISLKHEDNVIIFSVTDSGMGISGETRAKLFEKFSRGEGGKTNTGGSGLGLYLAKQIATAHKGDVTIESPGEGQGSTFSLILPALEHSN